MPLRLIMSKLDSFRLTAIRFSDYFGVDRPESNNIGIWWKKALSQMDKSQIDIMSVAFVESPNPFIKQLREALMQRKRELDDGSV